MVFSSIPFLFFFFPIFFILYFVVPGRFKNPVLLLFSLIFYAWGEPVYIVLMLFETLSDFLIGRRMEKSKHKKRWLVSSILIDLAILCFFKYANFLIGILNQIPGVDCPSLSLSLPIGISFFTFQTLSYVIDLYRGEVSAETNYFRYLTYVSMFPQLVAGPIVRYQTVKEDLTDRKPSREDVVSGFLRFLQGLFKKVLLANQIGVLWDTILMRGADERSLLVAWLGAVSFTFQIYYDFSGYSDMAIGMGRMMGFHFEENFNHPLMSLSITDFWRRWHISLSTWFRNYVYIPLGGNRRGKGLQIRNILVVWLLTGLWHGASWNFVMWGLYYGILLLIEKLFLGRFLSKWKKPFQHLYAFLIVVFGFVIFAIDDVGDLFIYIRTMFVPASWAQGLGYLLGNYGILLLFCFLCCGMIPKTWTDRLKSRKTMALLRPVVVVALLLVSIASLVQSSYNPFLYFRF